MAKKSFLSSIGGNLTIREMPPQREQTQQTAAGSKLPQTPAPAVRKGFLESYGTMLDGDAADVIPINLDNINRKRASRAVFTSKEVRLSAFVDADLYEKVQKVSQIKHVPLQDILNQLLLQYVQTNWNSVPKH